MIAINHNIADGRSQIVANCHKQPQQLFQKICVGVDDMTSELQETLASLLLLYPSITVVITVSPVRHWKDGGGEIQKCRAGL